jgi:Icc-related predicted phosphoesterase
MLITCVSDTHTNTPELPEADLCIHAGDLTIHGFRSEFYRQLVWLESQRKKFREMVLIAGNHDFYAEKYPHDIYKSCDDIGIMYLVNEGYITYNGLKLYGSPHVPDYHNWAFMLEDRKLFWAWQAIPVDTDILVTHGPPKDIMDVSYKDPGGNSGCKHLFNRVREINPKLHVFGHIHEQPGVMDFGKTKFVNAATKVIQVEI